MTLSSQLRRLLPIITAMLIGSGVFFLLNPSRVPAESTATVAATPTGIEGLITPTLPNIGAGRLHSGTPQLMFDESESDAADTELAVPAVAADWIQLNGRNLVYRGQAVVLRGANFANINALGARTSPTDRIGTGRPGDVTTDLSDYQELVRMGGNHVRFGIDFYWYVKNPSGFWAVLDQQISYAEQAGVWVLLNSFGNPSQNASDACYEGYSNVCDLWTSSTNQQALINWMVAIADRYKNRPNVIGLDPVNEPTVSNTDTWWKLAERIRDAVIAINPNLLIFVESGPDALFWRTLGANMVYQAHYYTPLAGTHCVYTSERVSYPGAAPLWDGSRPVFNAANLANPSHAASVFAAVPALQWADQNNVHVYVGEWGGATPSCYSGLFNYMADVAAVLNSKGYSWAVYSWEANEQRWGTFEEGPSLRPYSQAKYDMLVKAFGGQTTPQNTPSGAATATLTNTRAPTLTPTRTPTRTRTPAINPLPTNTTATRTPTGTPTLVPSSAATPTDDVGTPEPTVSPTCAPDQILIEVQIVDQRVQWCVWSAA